MLIGVIITILSIGYCVVYAVEAQKEIDRLDNKQPRDLKGRFGKKNFKKEKPRYWVAVGGGVYEY